MRSVAVRCATHDSVHGTGDAPRVGIVTAMHSARALRVLASALVAAACGTQTIPDSTVSEPSTTAGETTTTVTTEVPTSTTPAVRPTTSTTSDEGPPGSITFEELTRRPLVVRQGDIQIVFDQWFFSTFDPEARVRVEGPAGVLTEGLVAGEGAVMREDPPGLMHFFDSEGNEVAQLTSEELFRAAEEARLAAGL